MTAESATLARTEERVAPPDGESAAEHRPAHAPPVHNHHRARGRHIRQLLLAALLAAATIAVVLALRPRPVPVDVAHAARGPLAVVVDESGRTRVKDRYVVSAPVTGSLSRV